jgi:hypothetical protein
VVDAVAVNLRRRKRPGCLAGSEWRQLREFFEASPASTPIYTRMLRKVRHIAIVTWGEKRET